MADIITFTGQTNTVFLPSYEAPPGTKRRRWTVVGVKPDGTREYQPFRAGASPPTRSAGCSPVSTLTCASSPWQS